MVAEYECVFVHSLSVQNKKKIRLLNILLLNNINLNKVQQMYCNQVYDSSIIVSVYCEGDKTDREAQGRQEVWVFQRIQQPSGSSSFKASFLISSFHS